jgi:membrane protease YdiL (CAAX protease family)
MKKCPYCGKEYSDDVERCLIDNELLLGGETKASQKDEAASETEMAIISPPKSKPVWTEKEVQIFEIILVCTIAFGGSILSSINSLVDPTYIGSTSGGTAFRWFYSILRQASALGLLWYVLMRRGKSFSSLGLSWAWKDVGWAVLLAVTAHYIFRAVYDGFYFSGLTSVNQTAASNRVGYILFGGGITFVTILFQFLNPFFEELIVRAYVMTEVKVLTNSATKAIIISTALQTSYHFYQGAPAAFADGAMFLLFSIFYAKTNRIAPIILAHLYADVHSTLWYLFHH